MVIAIVHTFYDAANADHPSVFFCFFFLEEGQTSAYADCANSHGPFYTRCGPEWVQVPL